MSEPGAPVVADQLDLQLDTTGADYVAYSATASSVVVARGPQVWRYPLRPPLQPEVRSV